jgi:6-phosphogluconolactonase
LNQPSWFRNSCTEKLGRRLAPSILSSLVLLISIGIAGAAAPVAAQSAARSYFAFIGTYTKGMSKGIYSYRYDPGTGRLSHPTLAATLANPSFIIVDRTHTHLYAITETGANGPHDSTGSVSSFALDPHTGALTLLNTVPSGGSSTAHLALDHTGKMLVIANYSSGSVASFAIEPDGRIGRRTGFDQHTGSSVVRARQASPHPHEAVFSPDNRFLFVPDLGTDRVYSYRVDLAHQTIDPNTPAWFTVPPGLGPRHMLFGPGAKFVYLVCEVGSRVVVFQYNAAHGLLHVIQTISTLPQGFSGVDTSAEIQIDKAGRHLYASNRGDDSITLFNIDPHSGKVTKDQIESTQGKGPRNFVLDPSGKYLLAANQFTDNIVEFSVDPASGRIHPNGITEKIGAPVCILFVPERE